MVILDLIRFILLMVVVFLWMLSFNHVSSTNKKVIQEKTELIIPLIRANRWRGVKPEELEEEDDVEGVPKKRKKLPNAKKTGDDVTDQAVQEIIGTLSVRNALNREIIHSRRCDTGADWRRRRGQLSDSSPAKK